MPVQQQAPYYAQQPAGSNSTTVVIRDSGRPDGGYDRGPGYGGVAVGMAAGAVMGAALYSTGKSIKQ